MYVEVVPKQSDVDDFHSVTEDYFQPKCDSRASNNGDRWAAFSIGLQRGACGKQPQKKGLYIAAKPFFVTALGFKPKTF